jgi:hypothetical protein
MRSFLHNLSEPKDAKFLLLKFDLSSLHTVNEGLIELL